MESPEDYFERVTYTEFKQKWSNELLTHLNELSNQVNRFIEDEEFGLKHSYEVYSDAAELAAEIHELDGVKPNDLIISDIAVFHDIGKFFEEIHSLENISLAEAVYSLFAQKAKRDSEEVKKVVDGIKQSDFYNLRLDPSGQPPKSIEGELIRVADKMQGNFVTKVDRYWFKYGVPRGATFFDPNITNEERAAFSFNNFAGDQLNVILSIIALRPEDFSHAVLRQRYSIWSKSKKLEAVQRIIALAKEMGMGGHVPQIQEVINWYRSEFNC